MSVQGKLVPEHSQEECIVNMVFDSIKSDLGAQMQLSLVEVQRSVEALAGQANMLELVV